VTATLAGHGSDGAPVPPPDAAYWRFYQRVAAAQLATWLPEDVERVLDLSDGHDHFTDQLLDSGVDVVHVVRPDEEPPAEGPSRSDVSLLPVRADGRRLSWLQDACVDAVLAESRVLSLCLAAEVTVQDLHRVLRPGGRLLLVVESLATGLARLADQGRWAELADVPSADVLLVPGDDGTITRCFWTEELTALLRDAGFVVDWVRPRSVLSPAVVERAIAEGGEPALQLLVRTECALAEEREGDATGLHLVVSARRPD
jgi:SAM-dependent methyltransferase